MGTDPSVTPRARRRTVVPGVCPPVDYPFQDLLLARLLRGVEAAQPPLFEKGHPCLDPGPGRPPEPSPRSLSRRAAASADPVPAD